ncbi:c-type cytochrome [Deinococcus sp. PESE-13]
MSRFSSRLLWLAVPALLGTSVFAATTPGANPQATAAPKNPLALQFKTPSAARGATIAGTCAGCHGKTGVSVQADIPSLAGQIPNYTQFQLAAFRAKLRPSNVMQQVASKLSDQDIADLSAYYAAQAVGPAWKAEPAARARGQKLFTAGDPARNVIACAVCHGSNGRGLNANHIASVTNLPPEYALAVLKEFHEAPTFGGIVPPETMRIAVKPLTDKDLKDVATYISSMK